MDLQQKETWRKLLHLSARKRAEIWQIACKEQIFSYTENAFKGRFLQATDNLFSEPADEDQAFIFYLDDDYPALLKEIPYAPPLLFYRGDRSALLKKAISFVGPRFANNYGREATHFLIRGLRQTNWAIVSGLAKGVDTCAHQAASQAGLTTIAILGAGFGHIYPTENRALFQEIAEKGLVLSEYTFHTRPRKWHFPDRNRLISGISKGTVVVAARERSGSLITAYCALEQNREVFAVPGRIFDQEGRGCHRLIQEGAKLIFNSEHIIEEIG
ncbi:DNA-processing protein DprA [Listeria costaricensis]|uniref:DNA-processing protein DprA n=1 Tax=Listeria costaricensis TaxID=2026604 RepID=UPI0013C4F9CC|nr:DNA-processing protein DprA [Listeria costaricensis]